MIMILQTDLSCSEAINHKLTHVDREASVLEASKLMRKSCTTELLVTGASDGMLFPVGIVTALDIVTRVIAAELDPCVLTTGDIAWSGMNMPTSVDSDAGWLWHAPSDSGEALAVMDGDGRLVGTVRLDEFVLSVSP
jgi:CBS domain-containing protein